MTRLFEPDWPALYSAGPVRIPLEHGAYARLSRPFLDFFVGRAGYETITAAIRGHAMPPSFLRLLALQTEPKANRSLALHFGKSLLFHKRTLFKRENPPDLPF